MTIKDLINMCGTKTACAQTIGVSRRTVHNWHNGSTAPTWHHFMMLCALATVDPWAVEFPGGDALTDAVGGGE